MYNVIYNMYQNIKSRIIYNGKVSNYFDSNNGVRQWENLSPFLFLLYLNDLEKNLDENNTIGLISLTEDLEQELDTYLKLFILLYAWRHSNFSWKQWRYAKPNKLLIWFL
jgi:hypothetical protein